VRVALGLGRVHVQVMRQVHGWILVEEIVWVECVMDNVVGHGHIVAREVQSGRSYPCHDILLNNALAIEILIEVSWGSSRRFKS
jgi:hypothetical protein